MQVVVGEQISTDEHQIAKILISIICLYGNDGIPIDQVEKEFLSYCGFSIPWRQFGAETLRSWIITLPHIYIVMNRFNREILIEQSPKSNHIKDLIVKQKRGHVYNPSRQIVGVKRKNDHDDKGYNQPYKMKKRLECENLPEIRKSNHDENGHNQPYKMKNRLECENLPEGCFKHTAINNVPSDSGRYERYQELESMLPLFYKHQALGDDFFIDIADTKMGYYIPDKGPKKTGLCAVGQTIAELTEKVRKAVHLAPRVVVMIGFKDLIGGSRISSMITDLRQLVIELKKKNTRITLVTLIPSPKLPCFQTYVTRMDIFNKAIWDYASDPLLKCNIIDMNAIFMEENEKFKRDYDRFWKVTKKDSYRVFSDYGRKIFLGALKSCLKKQIERGH